MDRTAGQELYSDTAWQPRVVSGSGRKESEKEGKGLSTSVSNSSLAVLCAQCPTSPFVVHLSLCKVLKEHAATQRDYS